MAGGVPDPHLAAAVAETEASGTDATHNAHAANAADANRPGVDPAHDPIAASQPHTDDHAAGHDDESPPGPVDWGAWLVSAVGLGAGAAVALVLFAAIQHG